MSTLNRSYKDQIERAQNPDIRELLKMIAGRQYTSLADATLSSELRSIGTQLGARVAVRYARHMNIRDFNSGNYILIGKPGSSFSNRYSTFNLTVSAKISDSASETSIL